MVKMYLDPAEGGHLRLFYRDWRPTRLGKLVNACWAWVAGMGLTPQILLTLEVKGRRSGRFRHTVLVVAKHGGQRYLVSMLGDGSGLFATSALRAERLWSSMASQALCTLPKSPPVNEAQS